MYQFYHNRLGFVDCISKNIWVFFRFTVYMWHCVR